MRGPGPKAWDDANALKLIALSVADEGWGLCYGVKITNRGLGVTCSSVCATINDLFAA